MTRIEGKTLSMRELLDGYIHTNLVKTELALVLDAEVGYSQSHGLP